MPWVRMADSNKTILDLKTDLAVVKLWATSLDTEKYLVNMDILKPQCTFFMHALDCSRVERTHDRYDVTRCCLILIVIPN